MNLSISTSDLVTPRIIKLMEGMGGNNSELNAAMGHEVQRLTHFHLSFLAATRHTTASKLGATPSNHLAQAAEKVSAPSALSADSSSATLTINHPGMIRALRDVTIVPRDAKSLAIPVHALAYNRRPREIWDALKLFIPKGKNVICMPSGNTITTLYVLVRSVTQKQDRTLLPSQQNFEKAAKLGAQRYLKSLKQSQ